MGIWLVFSGPPVEEGGGGEMEDGTLMSGSSGWIGRLREGEVSGISVAMLRARRVVVLGEVRGGGREVESAAVEVMVYALKGLWTVRTGERFSRCR